MNASRRPQAIGIVVLAAMLAGALPAPALGQIPSQQGRLTRQDVQNLLAEARGALAEGDARRADALVKRAEASGIRYPMFYMGDTPASLRRDVDKALRNAPQRQVAPKQPSHYPATESDQTPPMPSLPQPESLAGGPAEPRALPRPGDGVAPLPTPSATQGAQDPKSEALQLMAASRAALRLGNLDRAEEYAARASALNVPEEQFAPQEDRPSRLAWDLQRARYEAESGMLTAANGGPSTGGAQQALHVAENDQTENQPATLEGPAGEGPRLALAQPTGDTRSAGQLLEAGEEALRQGQRARALGLFRKASERRAELDPVAQSRLGEHLSMLSDAAPESLAAPTDSAAQLPGGGGESMLDSATASQQVLARQLSSDVGKRQLEARRLRESQPREALQLLETTRQEVADSQLADQYRSQLVRRVDAAIEEMEQFIEANRAQIELDEQNAEVLAKVERSRDAKLKLQDKIAEMVDKFNQLVDEQRYAEAEIVAKRLYELAPHEPVVSQIWLNAKMIRREFMNADMLHRKEDSVFHALQDVEESAISNVFDGSEMVYDATTWPDAQRRSSLSESQGRRTEAELEIQQKLKTPVQLRYNNRPLSEVIDSLSSYTGVNIHLDPQGLRQEGVSSDTPVSIDLNNEVMLKSALNLILEPLHLAYVIKDEVLKITSEQLRDGEVYAKTYYVADLVMPIPNFVPNNNLGLQGLINDAHANLGYGARGYGAPGPIAYVNHQPQVGPNGQPLSEEVLANQLVPPNAGSGAMGGGTVPLGMGPGNMGGGVNADFDGLIDLIISTVASETWAENGGGEAEIRPFVGNLSLIISQTQAVHEEIQDLLEQLRRLQDLQITIEVRFIRLNDSFFERIGMDFDVNINDKTIQTSDLVPGANFETPRRSATVGIQEAAAEGFFPAFTSDLDLPFRQGSFSVAVPQFGGFDPTAASTFGFAILSDIEAYFLISAAQGDERTNMLNAPKVTLFNGQTAFVADTSQSPFVISVIPVVGEFAAAQQPVIVVLSEGTLMNIQAVVSDDRRYVRLTVVPFFSEIGDVDTFTFEGQTSSSSSSSTTDEDDDEDTSNSESEEQFSSGTTVQLPTFSFVSVSTTVSVPDGGTVLLGGIKRLSEGRNEVGVPLLSKLPYVNRLFKNVGIGRETDSLMMMVTPRIIIQEEEEQKLGLPVNGQ